MKKTTFREEFYADYIRKNDGASLAICEEAMTDDQIDMRAFRRLCLLCKEHTKGRITACMNSLIINPK